MDSRVVVELLEQVIGKQGRAQVVLRATGPRSLSDERPLTSVRARDDGLIVASRDDGWAVFDPGDVLAVEWIALDGQGTGSYL